MKKMVILLIAINLVFLGGCASTQAQRQAQAMQQNATETNSRLGVCLQEMQQNPSVQRIYEKVVVKADKDGYAINRFELLSNSDYLSDELRNHLIIFLTEADKCDQIMLDGASKYDIRVYKKLLEGKTNSEAFYEQLINKKINIGEFNTKRIDLKARVKQDLLSIQQQINGDLKLRHDAEAGERARLIEKMADDNQKAAEARAKAWQQYNRDTSLPHIYNTNCYQMGDQVHCTTQ